MRLYYESGDKNSTRKVVYPPDTKAFLYYSMSPKEPRIAGELRLRVTSSNDPASFESGSDLLKPNGQIWSRRLYTLSKYYLPLYERLREDRLIPDDLHTALAALPSRRSLPKHVLYTLNDTFIIDFTSLTTRLSVITEQSIQQLQLSDVFCDWRGGYRSWPYTGAYTSHHLSILLLIIFMNF